MDRRSLLVAAAGGTALSLAPRGRAQQPAEPLFRISLAQWSLHRALRRGTIDHLDFARVAAEDYGVEAVEYVSQFFPDRAGDFGFLGEMRARAEAAGVRSLLIMVDGEGELAAVDEAERRRAVERHFKWIAAAAFLGCHAVRVNAAGGGSRDEQRERAADSLVRLATVADDYGLDVLVENHGGASSDGAWLASVMRAADHPRVGTLPDFGNFHVEGGEWYDRYQGVAELMPFARAVSAKSHEFDADGEEVHTDYRRMLKIVVDSGYRGWIGIEYEGQEHDEPDGIRWTKSLLERVRAELA